MQPANPFCKTCRINNHPCPDGDRVDHAARAATDPREDLADAVAWAEQKASDLRDALILMLDRAGQVLADETTGRAMVADDDLIRRIGAIMMLCDGEGFWIHQFVDLAGTVVATSAPAMLDGYSKALVGGMVGIAMSCPCGACPFCAVRSRAPSDAEAERVITAELRKGISVQRPKSGLVDRRGRPLH